MALNSFARRAFVVTGGASGIGKATVAGLLRHTATVHVLDRTKSLPEDLKAVAAENGATLHFYPSVDVSSRQQVRTVFDSIFERSSHISGLVNSAGVCPSSGGVLEDDEAFHDTVNVNLVGTWNTATEILRKIIKEHGESPPFQWKPRENGICSVINIGSSASYYGYSTLSAYTATKHAVLGLTRSWAQDFAPYGVRVNLVAPGGTDTPLSRAQFDDAERGDMSRSAFPLIPMKRFAVPEELADAILYLLSDQSTYVTGQLLPVNGGWP